MKKKHLFVICSIICSFTSCASCSISRKIVVYTIPKCGTFMLLECIRLLTGKKCVYHGNMVTGQSLDRRIKNLTENQFLFIHGGYNSEDEEILDSNDTINFFLYRDPRDQIVSYIYHLRKGHPTYKKGKSNPFGDLDRPFDKLLYDFICDDLHFSFFLFSSKCVEGWLKDIDAMYRYYLPWRWCQSFCTIRFEDLVGPRGGGERDIQLREIRKIAQHLGLDVDEQMIERVADQIFGKSRTFRRGQIGSWKDHFEIIHKEAFKKVAGQLLIDLDYEKDFSW